MKIEFFYQIDYIDKDGKANYIDTFHNLDEAKKHWNILSNALACYSKNTKYVLDMYGYIVDELINESDEESDTLILQILPELELKNGEN